MLAGALLLAGCGALVFALRHFRRAPFPMIRLDAMAVPTFRVTMIGGSLFRASISAVPFLLPLLFQVGFGMDAFHSGLLVLAVFAGISRNKPKDRVTPLLEAPDADELINWLRRQPLLQVDEEKKLVMAHAGITPQWDLATAQACARDVEAVLASDSYPLFLDAMYGDMPNNWSPELTG
ncbi:hypothetical protein QCE80_16625, partial [Staphylococcus aureus]|nr:hypothetical protein [Staphylococcus aureus]